MFKFKQPKGNSSANRANRVMTGAVVISVAVACTANLTMSVLAENYNEKDNSVVAIESTPKVVSSVQLDLINYTIDMEEATNSIDNEIEQEVLTYVNIDYAQLKKTRLKEVINELSNLMSSINALGISQTEGGSQLYAELQAEYEEAVYTLDNGLYMYPYTDADYRLLAKVIMNEQGANTSPDEAQMLVGCVVLNRMANGGINGNLTNPTMLDILLEPGQYASHYTWNVDTSNVTDKVWENTRKVLEHEYEAPANVMYQATFKQGSGVYKSFYNGAPYNNTTYFCFV